MRPEKLVYQARMTQTSSVKDASGREFWTFAVDSRPEKKKDWQKNTWSGCVYVDREQVYVSYAGEAYDASRLLGASVKPVEGACVPASPPGA